MQGRGQRTDCADPAPGDGPQDLHADAVGSSSWQRGSNRRSALERINSRIDRVYGMESHFIRGRAKMALCRHLVVVVMMAMALGHVRAGRR